jgi:membrane protein YdbS with pleckstrin-like domain
MGWDPVGGFMPADTTRAEAADPRQGSGRHETVVGGTDMVVGARRAWWSRRTRADNVPDCPQETTMDEEGKSSAIDAAQTPEPAAASAPAGEPVAAGGGDAGPSEKSLPAFDGGEKAVDPRSVTAARVVAIPTVAGIALVPLVVVTIGWLLGSVPTGVYVPLLAGWVVVVAFSLWLSYKWPELHHDHLRYRVDQRGARIRRGVLWRRVISIPRSRVQHTDVSQGPMQRHYGIATLTVHTAGTANASISLAGLEHGVARHLRDHLLPDHDENGN